MPRSPKVTPNLGLGLRYRKMEIQGDPDPSPGDQIVAMRLLRRMGMETRMEMIDQMKEIEGHFFQFSHKLSMRWRLLCVQLGHNIALYTLLSIYQAYKSFCRNNKSFKVEKREKEHWSSKSRREKRNTG